MPSDFVSLTKSLFLNWWKCLPSVWIWREFPVLNGSPWKALSRCTLVLHMRIPDLARPGKKCRRGSCSFYLKSCPMLKAESGPTPQYSQLFRVYQRNIVYRIVWIEPTTYGLTSRRSASHFPWKLININIWNKTSYPYLFFLENYITSEGAVSHKVLCYQPPPITSYQLRFYANKYFE